MQSKSFASGWRFTPPTQHDLWEVTNDLGLTNVLQQEVEWYDTLHKVMPNLDVMTSGTIPKHPISLLNSPLMKELIVSLSGYYDRIIIDTPPLAPIGALYQDVTKKEQCSKHMLFRKFVKKNFQMFE